MKIHTSPPLGRDSLTSRTLGGLAATSDRQQRVWELQLVELYAEKGDPKFERAVLKYLIRCLTEGNPSLADVAQVAASLAERGLIMRGL
jgi:hypothetical protein